MPQKLPPRESERDLGRRYGVRSKGSPADRPTWDLTYEKPANLDALDGTEAIDNALVTMNADGTLGGAGSGQVDALQVLNAPAEAGATAGADWTTNLANRPEELTDGRVSTALNASGVLQTNIANASQIPNLTLSKITDAGTLAALNSVGPSQLTSGYGLVERASGAPTASSTRVYQDTSDGGVYSDDGSNVVKLSPTIMMPRLGSNTDFSSTSFEVVVQGTLGTRLSSALLWVAEVFDAFQAPDAASDVTYEGQWVLYLSDTSKATGDDPSSGGANITALWTGSVGGLTFAAPISAIEVDANDLDQNIYPTPKALGSTYAGAPAYLQLCLKRTAGSGAAKLSSAFGFNAYAVMG